jgi:hypothetical protein
VDVVDHEAERPVVRLEDDDVGLPARRASRLDPELCVQVDDRQESATEAVHRRPVDPLDALVGLVGVQPHEFKQAHLGNGVALPAGRDCQGRDDGQGERDLDLDRRPLARPALEVHGPADLLDVRLHHVHPDPAAREVGDTIGGREARQEHQVDKVAVGHPGGLVGGDQVGSDRLVPDPLRVDPSPVVGDLDDDLAPLVGRVQYKPALRRLAGGRPLGRRLDPVVDGVADHVGERIPDGLDDRLVQLGLLALHVEPHLLATGHGQVANDSRELAPDVSDRLHPGLHHPGLEFGREQVQPLDGAEERAIVLSGTELKDLVPGQDQLANQGHQLVEQTDVDPQAGVRDRPGPRLGRSRDGGNRDGWRRRFPVHRRRQAPAASTFLVAIRWRRGLPIHRRSQGRRHNGRDRHWSRLRRRGRGRQRRRRPRHRAGTAIVGQPF